jgi:autotransporter-associated beta strand protein
MKRTPAQNPILVSELKPARRLRPWLKQMTTVGLAAAALLLAASSPAALLTWDAGNTNNGATIDTASGSWNTDTTTNLNWNNGSSNVSWTQTSTVLPLNSATFSGPDAAAGTYQIALDGSQVAINSLTVNANGYLFSGFPLYFTNGILSVSNGVSVTFSNNLTGPNAVYNWRLGSGGAPATMSVLGNISGAQFSVGSTNGSTLWVAGNVSGGVFTINANVNQTNGTWANGTTWQVGRAGVSTQPDAGKAAFPGVYTMDGDTAILNLSQQMMISRNGGTGKVIIKKGTVNLNAVGVNATVEVLKEGNALGQGFFIMEGGTMTVGSASGAGVIGLAKSGSGTNSQAVFSQSGGTIKAWGGVSIGAATGTFNSSSLSAFTNSGGFLYIGNVGGVGITRYALAPATNSFVLSGGTIGALQSWISAMPMTLDTLNGNITFRCADEGSSPFNISLSGALTGPGGLYKTGGGTLTLSGTNNYAGSTVVSNGVLKIVPSVSPTNGPLTLDGSAGSPALSVAPASAGQFMTINGDLTYAAGSVTNDFNYGALQPSPLVAPIRVANNVACTVTPEFSVVGSAIPVGTYPLIKYGGTVSGTLPASPTVLPAATSGYLTNLIATKTIALVVTASPVSASLTWRVGSGDWGLIPALNWTVFGGPVNYTEPNAVQLDDTATGPFPVTVSNVSVVSPSSITVLGTNVWTISGNGGSIAGSAALTKAGSSTLTLSGTNTYSGGTTVSGGQLNINNGGSSTNDSAIGTGPLTLGLNAKVDNTSGQGVTLQPTIPQTWQDDWTYVGSTNLNTGAGAITLGNSVVVLTVSNSQLEVGGPISDGGNVYKLEKAGNGTLTLGADSTFTGGMQLNAGLLQLKTANGLGNGSLTFGGSAAMDNLSGADMAVTGITGITLPGSATVSYVGTSNSLDLGIVAAVLSGGPPLVINVANNALTFSGNFTSGNSIITKTGQGRLVLAGSGVSQFVGTVNEGELVLAHDLNSAIGTGDSGNGILVQSNAVVKLAGTLANQIPNAVDTRLSSGGVFDMNGNAEAIRTLAMTNGVLRNGLAASTATLTTANAVMLVGTNNLFDVPAADASLDLSGPVTGAGSLVKSGLGIVNLLGTNSYTGNTTVSNGTLTLNAPFLDAASTVTVCTNALPATNGVLNLNFTGSETNTVAALILGGVTKPDGIYNATTDPLYLAGLGSLKVVTPSLVSTNADLIALVLTPAGALTPAFSSNVLSYTATNAYGATPTVTVTNADLTATNHLIYGGATNLLVSGVPSSSLTLTLGVVNPVVVRVTAQDGVTVKTYTVNVTMLPSLTPPTLTNAVSGGTLTLSWPADHLGYSLQAQTNSRSVGLTANWVTLPGSQSVTTTNLPIDTANPTVFYRLVYP